jgi:hypothetical protein
MKLMGFLREIFFIAFLSTYIYERVWNFGFDKQRVAIGGRV